MADKKRILLNENVFENVHNDNDEIIYLTYGVSSADDHEGAAWRENSAPRRYSRHQLRGDWPSDTADSLAT